VGENLGQLFRITSCSVVPAATGSIGPHPEQPVYGMGIITTCTIFPPIPSIRRAQFRFPVHWAGMVRLVPRLEPVSETGTNHPRAAKHDNRFADESDLLSQLAQNPNTLPCVRYGYWQVWTAPSLARVGNPEAGLRMMRAKPELSPLHAETGTWAMAAALSGIGAGPAAGMPDRGPQPARRASSYTMPSRRPIMPA